jgi:diguanylate cyclase
VTLWGSRRLFLVAAVQLTAALVFAGWLAMMQPLGPEAVSAFSDVAGTAAALSASILLLRAAVRSSSVTRRAWFLIAMGAGFWGLGELTWTFYEVVLSVEAPFPSIADPWYLSGTFLLFLGALTLSSPLRSLTPARTTLDALAIALAGTAVLWQIALGPIIESPSASLGEKTLGLLYPFADLLILFAVCTALYWQRGNRSGTTLTLLTSGLVLFLASDVAFAYLATNDAYSTGSWVDFGWAYGFLLMGLAGATQEEWRSDFFVEREGAAAAPWKQALPLFLFGVTVSWVLILGNDLSVAGDLPLFAVVFTMMVVVFLRQVITLEENSRLRKQLEALVAAEREKARRDPLTGTLNHGAILDEVSEAMKRGPCTLLMLDIDDMKLINDGSGHQAGDAILIAVASALDQPDAVIGRYGGDEFIVLLPGVEGSAAAAYVAGVETRLGAALEGKKLQAFASLSCGTAVAPADGRTVDGLLSVADQRMYSAKRSKRGLSAAVPLAS